MNKCLKCGKETKNPKFCSKSCSAKINNLNVTRHSRKSAKWHPCVQCKELTANPKFCNRNCQRKYMSEQSISRFLTSGIWWKGVNKYLISLRGYKCEMCSNSTWNDLPITLELDHKDGKSENNHLDNLWLLCPNCHSQTPTYKSKNRGNGRHARRQRYADGKSY